MVTGLDFEVKDCTKYMSCIQAKHCRQPFKPIGHRQDRVLELTLYGLMETESIGGRCLFPDTSLTTQACVPAEIEEGGT